jgi:2-aminoethylphosphonate-pyruvate transaminase
MPDPLLLTPGPLTTLLTVRQATLHDWGSRNAAFIATNRRVRRGAPRPSGGIVS